MLVAPPGGAFDDGGRRQRLTEAARRLSGPAGECVMAGLGGKPGFGTVADQCRTVSPVGRQCEECVDDMGIEVGSAARDDVAKGPLGCEPWPVGTIAGQGVPDVSNRDDASDEGYVSATEVMGVSAGVPPFVVVQHGGEHLS